MQCPRCQQEYTTSQNFCGGCGAPVSRPNTSGPPAEAYAGLQRKVEQLTRALNESIEQQTATSEILGVISSSPTDVQPVFDIIAERAVKLCDAEFSVVSRFDGTLLQLEALRGLTGVGLEAVRGLFPMPLEIETVAAGPRSAPPRGARLLSRAEGPLPARRRCPRGAQGRADRAQHCLLGPGGSG